MARPLADKCHGNVVQIYTITTEQSSLGKATPIQVEGGLPESSVETNRLCKQRYIHVTEGKSTIHPLYLNLHSTYSKMTVDLCQKIPKKLRYRGGKLKNLLHSHSLKLALYWFQYFSWSIYNTY